MDGLNVEIEKGKEYIFNTTQNTLSKYNGTVVSIEFPLTEIGVDSTMYRAKFVNGSYEDVFEDELSEIK